MRDAVLIQACRSGDAVTGVDLFHEMMRLEYQRHAAYAHAHNMDYWHLCGDILTRPVGAWDKVELIRRALQAGYRWVFWIDADAAVSNMEADLRDALTTGVIGVCWHDPEKSEFLKKWNVPAHYNVGVLYVKQGAQAFIEDWLGRFPTNERFMEQAEFNKMALEPGYAGMVERVADTWNATVNVNMVPNPNVIGWHGVSPVAKRLGMVRDFCKDDFLRFRI